MKNAAIAVLVLVCAAIAAVLLMPRGSREPSDAGAPQTTTPETPTQPTAVRATSTPVRDKAPAAAPLPNGDFAQDRPELERRAREGDAKAALRLARVLTNCRGYRPVSDAELEKRVVDGIARRRNAYSLDAKPLPPEVLLDYAQREAREKDALCAGTKEQDFEPDNDLKTALRILQRAADAGDAEAMLEYTGLDFLDLRLASPAALIDHAEDMRERKRRVVDYLSRLQASGDARALKAYGDEYLYGRLYPWNVQKAYAYYYAYAQSDAAQAEKPWKSRMDLRYPESQLSPEQITQAQREGMALLAECCGAAVSKP